MLDQVAGFGDWIDPNGNLRGWVNGSRHVSSYLCVADNESMPPWVTFGQENELDGGNPVSGLSRCASANETATLDANVCYI